MQTDFHTYAALDLHTTTSVLGTMDADGRWRGTRRFPTAAGPLQQAVAALGGAGVALTLEASTLSRWAAGLLRPLLGRLVVCEPRRNRLISANPNKHDEADVEDLCLLLRLGKLQEVWLGEDPARQLHHELVAELLNWRDAARELKGLLKARYRQWGVLEVEGTGLFSPARRDRYLSQLPGEPQRRILRRLYAQHDATLGHWKETLRELRRAAAGFWEIGEFQRVPGIGEVGAHVFAALIGDPARFRSRQGLIKYARLAITNRSSDGKPLSHQRLDRRGHHELKTLSYHAWRTACKSTTRENAVQAYYRASRERTHDARHARLNTQRKILTTLWQMWLHRQPFDPARFSQTSDPPAKVDGQPAPAAAPG